MPAALEIGICFLKIFLNVYIKGIKYLFHLWHESKIREGLVVRLQNRMKANYAEQQFSEYTNYFFLSSSKNIYG